MSKSRVVILKNRVVCLVDLHKIRLEILRRYVFSLSFKKLTLKLTQTVVCKREIRNVPIYSAVHKYSIRFLRNKINFIKHIT